MKLLSIAISSYNAAAYLHYCVESLVIGGEQVGILIINDGSQDQTQEIAECLASKYPNIVRAIYQKNKCHGGAVNRGLAEASGRYFKVVDSDDWVDPRAYLKILEILQELESKGQEVDVFTPLQQVKTMYYLPVDFYRYLIGREDQSVNEQVMIKRIDQQLKVNRLLVDQLDLSQVSHPKMREYLLNHIEITTVISSTLLNRSETAEHLAKKRQLWTYIQQKNPEVFQAIRKTMLSRLTKHSVLPDRKLSNVVYQITKSVYGFN
ncbi:TPA: glycosyltransferase family 2 protein [Streptococcus pneumoniae]